jgi:hypothetical protein
MDEDELDEAAIRAQLEILRLQHQELEAAIEDLSTSPAPDQLQYARLKKRKLILRDQIVILENRLTPDIIA